MTIIGVLVASLENGTELGLTDEAEQDRMQTCREKQRRKTNKCMQSLDHNVKDSQNITLFELMKGTC